MSRTPSHVAHVTVPLKLDLDGDTAASTLAVLIRASLIEADVLAGELVVELVPV